MQTYFEIDIYTDNKYFDTLPFNFESAIDAQIWINNNSLEDEGFYKICRVTKEYID